MKKNIVKYVFLPYIYKIQKTYDILKAKLDISIVKDIYKLTQDEFYYMLESFKVLQNKQPNYIALLENLWEAGESILLISYNLVFSKEKIC